MLLETVKTLSQIIHGTIYTDIFSVVDDKKMAHKYLQANKASSTQLSD